MLPSMNTPLLWSAPAGFWCLAIVFAALNGVAWGETITVRVNRDAWVSTVGEEAVGNNGGADRLKLKGIQEFTLLDGDFSGVRGKTIRHAWLHLKKLGNEPLRRITVSSVSSPWIEGTGRNYEAQPGSACFRWARLKEKAWSFPGSDLTDVIGGQGNSCWNFADAEGPDAAGWYRVPIGVDVVAARIAGLSEGFAVLDDVGSEYTRDGERFEYHLFPNRYVCSRESGADRAPYFTLELDDAKAVPPQEVNGLTVANRFPADQPLPDGDARISWQSPATALGFDVRLALGGEEIPVPRYLIPLAATPGEKSLRLGDFKLKPGVPGEVWVRAVNAQGVRGPETHVSFVTASNAPSLLTLPANPLPSLPTGGELPRVGNASVFVIDAVDKYAAAKDALIPQRPPEYRAANHLWSASTRTVRLQSARNECVAFQLVLAGDAKHVRVSVKAPSGLSCRISRARSVPGELGPMPDPLLPWDSTNAVQETGSQVFYVECYVPHDAPAGLQSGEVLIQAADGSAMRLAIDLSVWRFTLPNVLSFIPQMNCYGLPDPPAEVAYYRLAHEHRTCLNRLGYNWRGQVNDGHAPKVVNNEPDWRAWDARFGPLLDGTAFAGLPRAGVPVDAFYLPLNENWPEPIEPAFQGGYWIENAFKPEYWAGFRRGVDWFGQHLAEKNWQGTFFEFYLNNKVYYKKERHGWSGCSAPWIFDEPVNAQDFWALRRYGVEFRQAATRWRAQVPLVYRLDVSYPQWQRDFLDGVGDVFVLGGSLREYQRNVRARQERFGGWTYMYGSANALNDANTQPVVWSLDAWSLGCAGVVPWQTIGTEDSWRRADSLALIYPGKPAGVDGPVPSLRLKAFRQGQQAVEYCVLWQQTTGRPRWAMETMLRDFLGFEGQLRKAGSDDAGTLAYRQADASRLWDLRARLGAALDALQLPAQRQIVNRQAPPSQFDAQWNPLVSP